MVITVTPPYYAEIIKGMGFVIIVKKTNTEFEAIYVEMVKHPELC